MAIQQLSWGQDDGATFGQSATDKISFYGATPVVRQAVAAYTTTTAPVSTSTNWGDSTSTQHVARNTAVIECIAALRNLGLGA
jgi:hypothetical protein